MRKFAMVWEKAGLACIVLAALSIVGYAQTTKPRAHSANLQGTSSGYLGVAVGELTAERMKALSLKDNEGVLVTMVTGGEAAARAGIHINDVILEINGQKVASDAEFANSIIGKTPGTKINLTIWRSGTRQNMVATLGLRPPDLPLTTSGAIPIGPMSPGDMAAMAAAMGAVDAPRVGFDGVELMPQLAEFFGVMGGVLVESVSARTPAEKAGLKAGDIVTKVNGMPVSNSREIAIVVRQANKKIVVFTVIRNKKEVTLNIELAWNRPDRSDRDTAN
jgi:serine protease Do